MKERDDCPGVVYQVGAPVDPQKLYIERPADNELPRLLAQHELCYVLAPRQIGKTSLCFRAGRHLARDGVRVAYVDMSGLASRNAAASQWYFGLTREIGTEFGISTDEVLGLWKSDSEAAPLSRWTRFVEELLLERFDTPVVIFLDEVDSILAGQVDEVDFFAAVRSLYNRRQLRPALNRLTFCLLGVATPTELMSDPVSTPFNIGRPVALRDFTPAEATPFQTGLQELGSDTKRLLNAVLDWTSGHPYLTQSVCGELAQRRRRPAGASEESWVAQVVEERFLRRGRIEDSNLSYASKRFAEAPLAAQELYSRILRGTRVASGDNNPAAVELQLAGMVAEHQDSDGCCLRVRNRIYAEVFDALWFHKHYPHAEAPRYRSQLVQEASEQLRDLRQRRNVVRASGGNTERLSSAILQFRRTLRDGRPEPGWTLGDERYLLLEELGHGGFATVWKARDHERNELVAIKVMHFHLSGDPVRLERFFRGARVMAELDHPNIVKVLEPHGEDAGNHYFVMELAEGGTLSDGVREGRLLRDEAVDCVLQVGDALAVAHDRGYVHRDIKPQNILLTARTEAKLSDFDLVGAGDTTGGTRTGALGTYAYAAPECMIRPQDATATADVYSLAMTMVFALSREDPSPRQINSNIKLLDCPPQLRGVLRRATSVVPSERHQSAAGLVAALRHAMSGAPTNTATFVPNVIGGASSNTAVIVPHHTTPLTPSTAASPSAKTASSPHPFAPFEEEQATRIGRYEIIRELGRGGMSVVYLARDPQLGRRVAVKLLNTANPELTARFIVEAQATALCSHENIVVIHEVGVCEGSPFMALEYLQGETLGALLQRVGRLLPNRVADIMSAVARALACAHSQGIVHRDLKPENIFMTASGTVKVLDFGIAKVLHEKSRPDSRGLPLVPADTQMTGLVGTMRYMSPEQWEIGGAIDHRTDIWAVGVMMFELLSGRHPLEDHFDDVAELQKWVTNTGNSMPNLLEAVPDMIPELAQVVTTCLSKNPTGRYPDAITLLKELEPFLPGRFRAWANFDKGPYAGLRAFQEEDAACFFGRDKEISALVNRIHDYPILAVVGPSGVGKSSFIRAGVVPALRSFRADWQVLIVRPGREPLRAMAAALARLMSGSTNFGADADEQTQLVIRLAIEPGHLGTVLRSHSQLTATRFLLFVDQFEELYTLCADADQRAAFANCLMGAADDATAPVRLIVSIRSDFLGRVGEDAHFMAELSRGLFFLGPPGPDALRAALVQPAELAGYRFESEAVVDDMVGHLDSTPGALPLLQFTAMQLWERRDASRHLLTDTAYQAIGRISGALAVHADTVVASLSPEARSVCRALFLQLVTPERTRAIRKLDELRELIQHPSLLQVVDELVNSRLLVVQTGAGSGGTTVEIVHESMIEAWLTLRRWLEESHEDSVFLEQLRMGARQWQTKRRDSGLVWGGEMAEELNRFLLRYRGELSDNVKAFAKAVNARRARQARIKRALGIAGFIALLLVAMMALTLLR